MSDSYVRKFFIPGNKPTYSRFFVDIDIKKWLDSAAINSADFTAIDTGDNSDVSDTVLDSSKCTYASGILKPYIRAGTSNHRYKAKIDFVDSNGDRDAVYLYWTVRDI